MFGLKPELLHEDLEPYIENSKDLGQILRHPLCYSVPYSSIFNPMLNKQYEWKLKTIEKCVAKRDFETTVFMYERPYRTGAFFQYLPDMGYTEALSTARNVWVDSEDIFNSKKQWVRFFNDINGSFDSFIGLDNLDLFQCLPETFKVYRGGTSQGLSWTLNKEKAKWFAKRHNSLYKTPNEWFSMDVLKKDVVGYIGDRDEDEIIIVKPNEEIVKNYTEIFSI